LFLWCFAAIIAGVKLEMISILLTGTKDSDMALHIALATIVDASWTGQIAISKDGGATWDTIHKNSITSISRQRVKDGVKAATSGTPLWSERIRVKSRETILLEFDVKDVANQSGWNVGGIAGMSAAHNDLADWIA
jgi:hypothetical protein